MLGSLQNGCVFFRENQVLSSLLGDPTSAKWWIQDFWGERKFCELPVLRSSRQDFSEAIKEYLGALGNLNTQFLKSWRAPDPSSYSRAFAQTREALTMQGLQKAVPVVQSWCEGAPDVTAIFAWILRGLEKSQNQWFYAHWTLDSGMLGVTPELLLDQKGNRIVTMALAGTRPESHSAELLTDPKELFEHRLVVEEIASSFRGLGEVSLQAVRTVVANGLAHLLTPIEVQLKSPILPEELVRLLHPTPALGCFPREKLSLLRELDIASLGKPRQFFGSPFGWYDNDTAEMIVSIRGIEWYENKTLITTGSGVVAQSTEENEWRELMLKQKRVHAFWMEPHVESTMV